MNNITSVEVRWAGRPVGRLAMTHEGLCAFEYSAEQLASGVSISPFEIVVGRILIKVKKNDFAA